MCLGLNWEEKTSHNQLRMKWLFRAPDDFRRRFIQGIADSDGSVKHHQVIITSFPNSEFLVEILQTLGISSAHVIQEYGRPLRVYVGSRESAGLPLFNEMVGGYRYQKLQKYPRPTPKNLKC